MKIGGEKYKKVYWLFNCIIMDNGWHIANFIIFFGIKTGINCIFMTFFVVWNRRFTSDLKLPQTYKNQF